MLALLAARSALLATLVAVLVVWFVRVLGLLVLTKDLFHDEVVIIMDLDLRLYVVFLIMVEVLAFVVVALALFEALVVARVSEPVFVFSVVFASILMMVLLLVIDVVVFAEEVVLSPTPCAIRFVLTVAAIVPLIALVPKGGPVVGELVLVVLHLKLVIAVVTVVLEMLLLAVPALVDEAKPM